MTKQEEQLWNYIDGFCDAEEHQAIAERLISDAAYRQLYEQLLAVNSTLGNLDVDEPSMSFTRNVMEAVKQEAAPKTLKTKVDVRIIYGIGGFFSMSLLGLLAYAFATADFTLKPPEINLQANFDGLVSPMFLGAFLFINAILLLVYLDSYLRKRMSKIKKDELEKG